MNENNFLKKLKTIFDKKSNIKTIGKNSSVWPKVLSVLAAFMLWLYVFQAVEYEKVIKNVPITFENFDASLGLDIVSGYESTVDVTVSGTKSIINSTTAEDIRVSVDMSDVTEIGFHELDVNVLVQGAATLHSQSMSKLQIFVDKTVEKEIDLVPVIERTIQNPYSLGEIVVKPRTVTVKGPETDINLVNKAIISANLGTIKNNIDSSLKIALVDSNDKEIDSRYINITPSFAELSIDVYKTAQFEIKPDILINKNDFDYTFYPEKIYLYGLVNDVDAITKVITEAYTVSNSGEYKVMLKLPKGVKVYTSYECDEASACDSITLTVKKKAE